MTRSWLRLLGGPAAVLIVALSAEAKAGPLQDCAAMLPWGAPVMAAQGAPHTDLCRLAYVLRHNDGRHVPDWVAWPPGIGATPADYNEPNYDQGHVAGDAYFNYAVEPERQSFLMSNMTPQTGASNRGPYRILEMASREWAAASNGGIWTIAGAIFGARPKTIGRTKVAVPAANWKIVVRDTRAVAVIIPNAQSYRGPHGWQDFIVPVAEIERQAG